MGFFQSKIIDTKKQVKSGITCCTDTKGSKNKGSKNKGSKNKKKEFNNGYNIERQGI